MRTDNQWAARWAPRWDKLRAVSNNPAGRAVIIVPLVGYWIILNDWVVRTILPLAKRLVGEMPTHTPWQLFATYFGLWLVGVGSAFYLVFCPPDLKRFATSSEYTGRLGATVSPLEMKRIGDALKQGDQITKDAMREYETAMTEEDRKIRRDSRPDMDQIILIREDWRRDLLKLHFDLCNGYYPTVRLITTVLYIFGFSALALPSLSLFCKVAVVAMHTGFGAHPMSP
jgi:hypothetical protein